MAKNSREAKLTLALGGTGTTNRKADTPDDVKRALGRPLKDFRDFATDAAAADVCATS